MNTCAFLCEHLGSVISKVKSMNMHSKAGGYNMNDVELTAIRAAKT